MKLTIVKISHWSFSLLLGLLLFSACQDDESAMDNNDQDSEQTVSIDELAAGELRVVVDGEILTAQTVSAVLTGEHFSLSVVFPDGKGMTVITDTLRQASFDFTSNSQASFVTYMENITAENPLSYTVGAEAGSGGEIEFATVSEDENTISGTFRFTLHPENGGGDPVVISSAAFNQIPYIVQLGSVNSFSATVNGEAWTADAVTASINQQVDFLDVRGSTADGVDINIFMPADVEEGVYQLTGNGDYVASIYPEGESIGTHFSSSGELTIIHHDQENNIIEAEFFFDATRPGDEQVYEVGEGSFSYDGYY